MEYERLEPWGSWRDNLHAAMIATILANAHRDPKRPPMRMSEFFYADPEAAQQQNDITMLAALRAMKRKE